MCQSETPKYNDSILLITWNFPPKKGGMENLIHDIYRHLSSEYSITVIAPYSSDREDKNIYRPKYQGFFYFIWFAIFKGASLIRKQRYKCLFGGSLAVLPVLFILKLLFRVKSVAYAHGLDIIYDNRIYQLILKMLIPIMDGFICNSRNTRNILENKFSRAKNVAVIPPGLDMNQYDIQTKRPYSRRYILSVGRLTERKGLIQFIENSFVHIAKEFPDVDFVIVGDEPKEAMYHKIGYKKKVKECIDEHGLQDRVVLYGWADEKEKLALYQHCECLVFPVVPAKYDVEGFGIVAIEAGSVGKHTVAFNVGGIRDAVINGKTGALVDSKDYASMTLEIKKIMNRTTNEHNSEICNAIRDKYSWSVLVDSYNKYLSSLS